MAADILKYDRGAAGLHWLTAILVIALIVLGIGGSMEGEPLGLSRYDTLYLHKSLGITVFGLTLLRLAWRLGHKPPPLPETTPPWQRRSAHALHHTFYAFLLGMPLLGYLFSSGGPYPLEWFGQRLPKAPIAKPIAEIAGEVHEIGGLTMATLVVVHIAAALWHQFVQRDRLVARMRIG